MFTTSVIAFREFFEAFLIVGIFLGISRSLGLKKEFEILLAAGMGILVSLFLAVGAYAVGNHVRAVLTEDNAEFLESLLLIFSGVFIAYVVFSLHGILGRSHRKMIRDTEARFKAQAFDVSLFFTIMFLVMREGFEIAIFTSSIALFTTFLQNFLGLLIGLVLSLGVGLASFFAYTAFEARKVFRATEYLIILLGASLTQIGITKLLETRFGLDLSIIGAIHLGFLPDGESIIGHALQSMLGIDQNFSFARLAIMIVYIGFIYLFFLRRREPKATPKSGI